MRIGTIDSSFKVKDSPANWPQMFKSAAAVGLEGIEVGVFDNHEQSVLWTNDGRHQLNGLVEETGVVVPSICIHSFWKISCANDDASVREAARKLASGAIDSAAALGAKNILMPLTSPKEVPVEAARERWIEIMSLVKGEAESAGVTICLENVNQPFANHPETILPIVSAIGSPNVQIYYDPTNAVGSGDDPVPQVKSYGSTIKQLHVKERGATYVGDGEVPWPGIAAALKEIGYDGWLIFETQATDNPEEAARKNIAATRKLFGL